MELEMGTDLVRLSGVSQYKACLNLRSGFPVFGHLDWDQEDSRSWSDLHQSLQVYLLDSQVSSKVALVILKAEEDLSSLLELDLSGDLLPSLPLPSELLRRPKNLRGFCST